MLDTNQTEEFILNLDQEIPTAFDRIDELRLKLENRISLSQANLAKSYELIMQASTAKHATFR